MSIQFRCNHCNKRVQAPDAASGKKAKCPICGQLNEVPAVEDEDDDPFAGLDEFMAAHGSESGNPESAPKTASAPPPPPVVITPPPLSGPPPDVQVAIEHRHKATGGAFRTGFGFALGCLVAGAAFIIGGFLVLGFLAAGLSDAVDEKLESPVDTSSGDSDFSKIVGEAQREAARMERQLSGSTKLPQNKTAQSSFSYSNVTMRSEKLLGLLRVLGEVTNHSGKDYSNAIFVVTLYNENGGLIDSGEAIVFNLVDGQTKTFEAAFFGVSAEKVEKYKIQFETAF